QSLACVVRYRPRSRRGSQRRGGVALPPQGPPALRPAHQAGQPEFDSFPPPLRDIHIIYLSQVRGNGFLRLLPLSLTLTAFGHFCFSRIRHRTLLPVALERALRSTTDPPAFSRELPGKRNW